MTPRQFRKKYRSDERISTGSFYQAEGVSIHAGEKVGVVLLSLGGPGGRSDVEDFLYRRWMDPILEPSRITRGRHYLVRVAARIGARFLWKDYEQIGGQCPINRLTREQAAALQKYLTEKVLPESETGFRTYIAMRYGHPASEDALAQMKSDGITRIVLLPLYPQYSIATTGSSLAYWSAMAEAADRKDIPTTAVLEYAGHPGYIRALNDRIDQALQRFPKRVRSDTHLVFSAEQSVLGGHIRNDESFCGHVRETVRAVMSSRENQNFHVTFFDASDEMGRALHPDTRLTLQKLVSEGVRSLLVVPLGIATDHLWTAYTLDIDLRKEMDEFGVEYYEVAAALNCHPQFIGALGDIVADHLRSTSAGYGERGRNVDHVSGMEASNDRTRSGPGCPSCVAPITPRDWSGASGDGSRQMIQELARRNHES